MRLPSLQGLLAFEALARLRSVNLAADELNITPSAVSHRIRQLETQLQIGLFNSRGFSLTTNGGVYLTRVREAIAALEQVPGREAGSGAQKKLHIAAPPTFLRQMLLPRLPAFCHAHPDIELVLHVTTPTPSVTVDEADIELRFGNAPLHDRDFVRLPDNEISPVCSPDYLERYGPFHDFICDSDINRAHLLRTPLESWGTWFTSHGIRRPEPATGNQFGDLGLMFDAATAGFGVALMRLKLGSAWLEDGKLVRISTFSAISQKAYYLCWRPGNLDRLECAIFVEWLRQAMSTNY